MRGRTLGLLGLMGGLAVAVVIGVVTVSGPDALPGWRHAVAPGPLSARHAQLEGRCETCHTPYAGVAAVACVACHADAAALLGQPSTAFHAVADTCAGCHVEHRGGARPTAMSHAVLVSIGARSRLAGDRSLWVKLARQVAGLAEPDPAPEAALDCFTCHAARNPHHDGDPAGCCGHIGPGTVGSLFGRACADCHVTTSWKIAGYRHPSPRSTDCDQCHQAPPSHFMGHFEMISKPVAGQMQARVDQCHLCHQTDAWNDIKGAGWYKHH